MQTLLQTGMLCSVLLFGSCGKGLIGPARVDGLVSDATTLDPIYNAKVFLLEAESSFDFLGPSPAYIIIDSTTTGAFGKLEFTYEERNGYAYAAFATKENYWEQVAPETILSLGSGIDLEVQLKPEAVLRLRVHNVNIYDPGDYISIGSFNIGTFYGNDIDTLLNIKVYGNVENRLVWGVVDDGIPPEINTINYIDCLAIDTTYYEILY